MRLWVKIQVLKYESNPMKKLLFISLLVLIAGCESGTLETGYSPHKLTDSSTIRQGYYASPYSPEATRANQGGTDIGMTAPSRY